jgi:hypothetical protein
VEEMMQAWMWCVVAFCLALAGVTGYYTNLCYKTDFGLMMGIATLIAIQLAVLFVYCAITVCQPLG